MDTIPEDHIVQIHHGDRDQYAAETSFAVTYSNATSASAVVDLDPDQTEDEPSDKPNDVSNDSFGAHGDEDKYGDQTDDEFYDGDQNGYQNGNVRKDEHTDDHNCDYRSRDQNNEADENPSDLGVHESHQVPNNDPSEPVQNGMNHDPDITHVPSDPETFSNSDYGSTTQLGVQSQSHPNYAHMVGTAQKYVVDKKKKKSPAKKARKCCGGIIMLGLFFFILISILIGFYSKLYFGRTTLNK